MYLFLHHTDALISGKKKRPRYDGTRMALLSELVNYTLWLFNIAMENSPCTDVVWWFTYIYLLKMVMFYSYVSHNQRVYMVIMIFMGLQIHSIIPEKYIRKIPWNSQNFSAFFQPGYLGTWVPHQDSEWMDLILDQFDAIASNVHHLHRLQAKGRGDWEDWDTGQEMANIKEWNISHDGSMVLLYIYMVTWIPSIYPSHVSIYTIHGSYG